MASLSKRGGTRHFRFADLVVSSPVDLPELEEVQRPAATGTVIELSLRAQGIPAIVDTPLGGTSVGADEQYTLARTGTAFVCRFGGAADFLLTPGVGIDIHPAQGTCAHTLRHLLLDHVLPRFVAHQGRVVIHAASVRLGAETLVFLGPSGVGKSTLAASFLAEGYPVESDDAVALSIARGRVAALSTYRTLRLWPASVGGLYAEPPELSPVAAGSDKRRLVLPRGDGKALPLSALFVLAASDRGARHEVSLSKLTPHQACMVLIENSFQLDPSDPRSAGMLFDAAAAVANRVPTYRLAYPRSFASLPAARAAMLQRLADDDHRQPLEAR